jgi:hypothetical protein
MDHSGEGELLSGPEVPIGSEWRAGGSFEGQPVAVEAFVSQARRS